MLASLLVPHNYNSGYSTTVPSYLEKVNYMHNHHNRSKQARFIFKDQHKAEASNQRILMILTCNYFNGKKIKFN